MALDVTHSERSLMYSIKRYFNEQLQDIFIGYQTLHMDIKDDLDNRERTWIVFHMGGTRDSGVIKDVSLNAYIFSRGESPLSPEDLLSQTRDLLYGSLIDLDQSDGLARIPLYNIDDKSVAGSLLVYPHGSRENERARDNTVYRLVPIRLKLVVK